MRKLQQRLRIEDMEKDSPPQRGGRCLRLGQGNRRRRTMPKRYWLYIALLR